MSVQAAREFLDLFTQDEPIQTQYDVADIDDMHELITFAGQKGYKISEADLRAAVMTLPEDSPVRIWLRY
jgi:hypothetical protein